MFSQFKQDGNKRILLTKNSFMMPFGIFCISFIIVYSQRLEETTAALQVTSEALEQEKAKTDMLLHQMLPVKVAEALKDGHRVEAGKGLLH